MKNDAVEDFVRQFSRCQLQILGFIQVLVPSTNDAEDILQETSVILWNKWSEFDQSRDFASWACGVARFEVFKHLRKKKTRVFLSESILQQLGDVAISELRSREDDQARQEALANCLEELPPKDKFLFHEKFRNEKSVANIAIEQSKTERAIYKRLSAMREILHRCIQRRTNEVTA